MDPAHIHLLTNHLPIIGSLFSLILLAYGMIFNNNTISKAGLTSIFVVALCTIPAYLSGEEAEEQIEHMQGVSKHFLHEHEEHAETSFIIMLVTGGVALLTLIMELTRLLKNTRILKLMTLILTATTFGFMVLVGFYGGKITHSELRDEIVPNSGNQILPQGSAVEDDDD